MLKTIPCLKALGLCCWVGVVGLRPGVSQPQDRMFILWALIEEQQRLIFMEKKIIKAGKGRGRRGKVWFSSQTPRGCGRLGRGSAHRSTVGVGHSVRVGGVPLDFVQKAGEPPAGLPSLQRPEWASPRCFG